MPITDRQEHLYRFIVQYKLQHDGCAPSIRKIMQGADFKSSAAVSYALGRLVKAGLLEIDPANAAAIRVVGGKWRPPADPFRTKERPTP